MSYTNPLHSRSFADPFVLKFNGRYYAYATGEGEGGRIFPMMTSVDLVSWQELPGAMLPLEDPAAREYWAPEVAYVDGIFYLYYAVIAFGTEEHHLRVAASDSPVGPFRDCGVNMTPEEIFAIDAHPFRDEDGQWYLFYARDYLEPPFVGTGLAVDRLESMTRLSGKAARVLRPYADWQLYEKQRAEKGGIDWYTAEGPFVRKRHGRYICLYSGGAWQFPNYGVADVVSDIPMGPHGLEDRSYWDHYNRGGPQLLRTIPGQVLGPGHNSIALAPNNVEEFLVYHGWDPEGTNRMLRIDRLFWHGERPFSNGASCTPQEAPGLPPFQDLVDRPDDGSAGPLWQPSTGWCVREGTLRPIAADVRPLESTAGPAAYFLLEVNLRTQGTEPAGVVLRGEEGEVARILLDTGAGRLQIGGPLHGSVEVSSSNPAAWRQLLIEKDGSLVRVSLDGRLAHTGLVEEGPCRFALAGGPSAAFTGIAFTPHFLDDFAEGAARGWMPVLGSDYTEGRWVVSSVSEQDCSTLRSISRGGRLEQRDVQAPMAAICKGDPVENLEASVDMELLTANPEGGRAGLLLGLRRDGSALWTWRVFVERGSTGWLIGAEEWKGARVSRQVENLALLEKGANAGGSLRARVMQGRLEVFWDEHPVLVGEPEPIIEEGMMEVLVSEDEDTPLAGPAALFTDRAAAAFSNVRVTGLKSQ